MFNKTDTAKSSDTPKTPLTLTESNKDVTKNNKIVLRSNQSTTTDNNSKDSITGKFRKLSLRTKATIIGIAIGTLPVLGFGILSYLIASKSIENKVFQLQQSETEDLADKVNRFLLERYANAQVLASLPTLKNWKIREVIPHQDKQAFLDKIIESKVYDSIAVIDLDGNVILQSPSNVLPTNLAHQSYIQTAKQSDRPYISQPQVSPPSDKPSIYAVVPVKDHTSNETVALLRVSIPVQSLENVIKNYGEEGRKYGIADANGKLFIAAQKNLLGKNINTDKLGGDELVTYLFKVYLI